jgi:hypothetical protein
MFSLGIRVKEEFILYARIAAVIFGPHPLHMMLKRILVVL